MATLFKTITKKWGNSIAIVIPQEIIDRESINKTMLKPELSLKEVSPMISHETSNTKSITFGENTGQMVFLASKVKQEVENGPLK